MSPDPFLIAVIFFTLCVPVFAQNEPWVVRTNSIGMRFVEIEAAKFKMGSGEKEVNRDTDELQHEVEISRPFLIGQFEVTFGQFKAFVDDTKYVSDAERKVKERDKGAYGWNPDKNKIEFDEKFCWRFIGFKQTIDHPVVCVSWNDANAFCKWLSKKEGKSYRLPTEAEWELACRGGNVAPYSFGDDIHLLVEYGNVADFSAMKKISWDNVNPLDDGFAFTSKVGQFKPNKFGVYDMHGNVREWCSDWYKKTYYKDSPEKDPLGPKTGTFRVLRGGSWSAFPGRMRGADRFFIRPSDRGCANGFRILLEIEKR